MLPILLIMGYRICTLNAFGVTGLLDGPHTHLGTYLRLGQVA
jgi:hypothetical protein